LKNAKKMKKFRKCAKEAFLQSISDDGQRDNTYNLIDGNEEYRVRDRKEIGRQEMLL
jgi:hypothetical protein